MARVLATDEAKTAIHKMQTLINGDLESLLSQLDVQGQKLCDPNVWDGARAGEFRHDVWPTTHKSLHNVKTALDSLRGKLDQITTDIMQAGGN
jgi:uncharacterized protein YukE